MHVDVDELTKRLSKLDIDSVSNMSVGKVQQFFTEELPDLTEDQLARVFATFSYYLLQGVAVFKDEDNIAIILGLTAKAFADMYVNLKGD